MKNIITNLGINNNPQCFVKEEIRKNNIQRIIIFSLLAIPINIVHIVLFYFNLDEPGSLTYQWGISIIWSHFASLLFFSFTGSWFYYVRKKGRLSAKTIDPIFVLIFFFMLMLGITIVSFDQIITPAITPFLVFCAIISLIVLIPPIFAVSLFIISYLLFYFGIAIFQSNIDILLSNRVNGLTAIFVGILLSIILWRFTVTRYEQSHIIRFQKMKLEEHIISLQNKSNELEIANASKDRLFSIIAHDLTTPFNLITGLSEFLKENIRSYTIDELEKYLSDINKISFQAQLLLQELLTWARLQTDNLLFNPESIQLFHIAAKVKESLHPISSNKKIDIEINIPETIYVMVDKEMTKTILRNLIANAIKYSFEGSKVIVNADELSKDIEISVTDEGTGIEPEKINNLFSESPKQSVLGTQNEKGSGIGLILCKEFVEKHGGIIRVESIVNLGTKFFFTLPKSN